jgi:hypothetical protein
VDPVLRYIMLMVMLVTVRMLVMRHARKSPIDSSRSGNDVQT